jgi:hypothetical protein
MKKGLLLLAVVVVVGLCASSVFAVIGPPTAGLNKGQWSAGFDYSYSAQGLETTTLKGTYFNGTTTVPTSTKLKFTKELETQRYYGTIGYGIDDWLELNVSLGMADVEGTYKQVDTSDTTEHVINFDNDFAWGWGTKITFAKQDKVNWGVAVQMNWLDTSLGYDTTSGTRLYKRTIGLSSYDLLVAVGPTIDMGGWKLYGGPFYYYLDGDLDSKVIRYNSGALGFIDKESGDIKAKDNFGGFIGAQIDIAQNCSAAVEFGSTFSDTWSLGTGITFKF